MDEPDPGLVRAAQAGDLRAFEALIRSCQAPVWRFLRHFLGDATLAEDVTQETFMRVHAHLDRFDGRARFTTWVFQIARNAGIDAARSRDRRSRLSDRAVPPAPAPSPELSLELTAALASLKPELREALLSVELLGLSYVEAGELLGVPAGTVKSRVFRARERVVGWLRAGEDSGEM